MTERAFSHFDPPPSAEVLVVTHLLEMPRDLQIPENMTLGLFEPRDDAKVFEEWPDDVWAAVVGLESLRTPGTRPIQRVVFRSRLLRSRAPLLAADEAFSQWVRALLTNKEMRIRKRGTRRFRSGVEQWVTIAAVTRYIPRELWPDDAENQEDTLSEELDGALATLNDFIVALSLVRNSPELAPVARGEFPRVCPVIVEALPVTDGRRVGATFIYQIHERRSALGIRVGQPQFDDELLQHAVSLAEAAHFGGEPFFLFYELIQQAAAELMAHRAAPAAIAIGSAVEVVFSATIREAGRMIGEAEARTKSVLSLPLRNQVEHHLMRYAGVTVDTMDSTNPFGHWWTGGYNLRNRVVHEGYRPSQAEAEAAYGDAAEVVGAIRDGLRSSSATRELGLALQWGRIGEEKDGEFSPKSDDVSEPS